MSSCLLSPPVLFCQIIFIYIEFISLHNTCLFYYKFLLPFTTTPRSFSSMFLSGKHSKSRFTTLYTTYTFYGSRSCFIIDLFQEYHFHQILSTCNVIYILIHHYILASLFMLHVNIQLSMSSLKSARI